MCIRDRLGTKVPKITIPVRPGRNVAIIMEVAAMNFRLKSMGHNPADALDQKMLEPVSYTHLDVYKRQFLGVCHSMAHKLGAFHHLPHGIANALMIEEVLRFNAEEGPRKMGTFPQYAYPHTLARYCQVADALGIGGKTDGEKFENLIKAIRQLKKSVDVKDSISEYGVDEKKFLDQLDEMVEQAFDDQCTGANPRYPLMSEIKDMYLTAYYGNK